ncbi:MULTISPECIES: hypothetical protein [unclassified Salinivibrio]|uniref:hypothetical protein n=1 Tax=unclassified Salinivibrio TaxID=2636825 RepID=UPI000614833A|nr:MULTISPECIES: hypothetical protein [unclassified Salinivibrio]KKA45990.1 hypothetical protein WN56_02435 [Salinivibrio sp. KP-1]OOE65383.1 hypothetical protein BZG20_12870 [Salinivibrio sp. IB868]OOE77446.1 hypothetical protein BZG22_03070 [Salinivibrio sp. IB870]
MKTINTCVVLFFSSLVLSSKAASELPINKSNVTGQWICSFTMQGDKVYKEKWALKDNKEFVLNGRVEYFLGEESARFSYNATGEWELINDTIKLAYNPFEFQSNDSFSQAYLSEIETVYITPAWNGTRRFQYDVEALSKSRMQIGDDYDSWQCKRNKRVG